MTDFLIKSSLSLGALLIAYYLFLEKEKMHQFNRFYLLFSLLFSFTIPYITIEIIQEIPHQETIIPIAETTSMPIIVESVNYWLIAAWSMYGIITFILLFRFVLNIWKLNTRTKSNPIINYKNAKLVLLKEKVLPHTFLNHIFINEMDYHNRKIEDELYTHELIHVNQKHTLDILFIEILKTIFWFNPIFIFYKKAIQLNHEFLADEKVVQSHNNVLYYQNLLISKVNTNPPYYLASNLNYLVTKKRLIMMTKNTSPAKGLIKKLTLIPFVFGLIFFLCLKTVAQEKTRTAQSQSPKKELTKDARRDAYYEEVKVIVKDNSGNTIIDKKYEELSLVEKNRFLNYVPSPVFKKNPTDKEFNNWKNEKDFAIWLDGKNIPNLELDKYSAKDIAYFTGSFVHTNARTKKHPQLHQFNLYTLSYFDKNLKNAHLKFSGKTLEMRVGNQQRKAIPQPTIQTKEVVESLNKKVVEGENDVYNTENVEIKPDFQGGMKKFYEFVAKNFKTPEISKLSGRVYVTFIIEKDGSLSNIKNIKDMGYGTGDEAIRVLKLSPNWLPAKMNGKPVRCTFSLPIAIQSAN